MTTSSSKNPNRNPDPNPRPKKWLAALFLAAGFAIGAATVFVLSRPKAPEEPAAPRAAVAKPAVKAKRAREIPPAPVPRPASAAPRVAFVLDDWGYNLQAFPLLKEIDQPMTLAVLPHLKHSKYVAENGFAEGNEII